MGLDRYQAKRDFGRTPEPRGEVKTDTTPALSFVVQKHAASHLHYDFRLELNGVLLSWAVPRGPSLDPQDKRLAVHVEDHPLDYDRFEGVIPAGEYGAGTVMVWDRGTWAALGDVQAGYANGNLKFRLQGERLKGHWVLVRSHGNKTGADGKLDTAWWLIKEKDAFAKRGAEARIVEREPDSVASGRSIEEIALAHEHEWHSSKSVDENLRADAIRPARANALPAGTRRAEMPAMLQPALATVADTAPTGDEWLHEVKYDGYRLLCRIEAGKVRLFSRNGIDYTPKLPLLAAQAGRLKLDDAWFDGELCVADADGRTSFQALQNVMKNGERAGGRAGAQAGGYESLTYFIFDLLYLDGYDWRGAVLSERKQRLKAILQGTAGPLRYSIDVVGSGIEMFRQACHLQLEGIVSKRADSRYQTGLRTRDWLKIKCTQRQEMVIGGFTEPKQAHDGFGALLLGVYVDHGNNGDKDLRYCGKVGTGFDTVMRKSLRLKLDQLAQTEPPFTNPPRGVEAKGAHWVRPQLVADVAFAEWSKGGALRHPSLLGLRDDKPALEVVREPTAARTAIPTTSSDSPPTNTITNAIAGVTLSHPEKLMFPDAGLQKIDLARYYAAVGEWMLPHLLDRPLSLVRCPDGWQQQCFYQKHADKSVHAAVSRLRVAEGDGTAVYCAANSVAALIGLVQWGVIELHPWGSRAPSPAKNPAQNSAQISANPTRPDRLIFDFDPDEKLAWPRLVEAVQLLRTLFDDLGLTVFLKTTGGKGLHVVVPIRRTLDWSTAKGFSKSIAVLLERTFPDRFTASMSKARREGRIFIDYLRNTEGATAIAPYSIRARAGAPVAMPIAWDDLSIDPRFAYFNVLNTPARLRSRQNDPWARLAQTSQTVTKAMRQRVE